MRESITGSCWAEEANAGAIGDRPRKEPERFSRAPCVCESVTDLSRDSERPHKADGYSRDKQIRRRALNDTEPQAELCC